MTRNSLPPIALTFAGATLLFFALTPRGSARQAAQTKKPAGKDAGSLQFPGEKHLANIRQLTFGGQSAEAYFSADDKYLSFQHQGQFFDPATSNPVGPNIPCDQIFTITVPAPGERPANPKPISNAKGRTTCSYFFPSGDRVLYSSTFAAN